MAAATVIVAGVFTAAAAAATAPRPAGAAGAAHRLYTGWQWPLSGQNIHNTRYQAAEHKISPATVSGLAPKWTLTTKGNVSATPTVADGVVYVPDQGGTLWAVDAQSGAVRWSATIASYTGVAGDLSRTSPAIAGDELITGDGWAVGPNTGGAQVFAVNRTTGQLLWSTKVDTHPASMITSSPVVYGGVAYVGVASKEETLALNPAYPCCTFRGAVVALNVRTGQMLWKTYTVPSNNNGSDANLPEFYSGGAVWDSSPVVDARRGLLYVGTGNNYTVPPGVCTKPGETGCTAPDAGDRIDSILALLLSTGATVWADRTIDADVFSGACQPSACGPDFDFGSAPNLFTTINPSTGLPEQLLGIGQKSGIYWAVQPGTGKIVWTTRVGPSGNLGGIEWGSATDGRRIYVAEANSSFVPYTLGGSGPYAGQTVTGGSWAALDAATGKILWQTPDPQGAMDLGYVSAADRVVYAGSAIGFGQNMYALDARTGKILWGFASGGAVVSGAAIVNGSVYWGSGYYFSNCLPGAPGCGINNKLYAFSLPSGAGDR